MKRLSFILLSLFVSSTFAIDTQNDGFKINAGATVVVDVHSNCKAVTNGSSSAQFVPTKTSIEWDSFLAHLPTGMSVGGCYVPGTHTYTSSDTWVAPYGATSVTVEAWGGGGGGGAGSSSSGVGGGGAGGSYAKKVVAVTPGQTYTVTVGTGGPRGTSGGNGQNGGASWFSTAGTVYAQGGAKGNGNGTDRVGGLGSTASCIGDTFYKGGNGADGSLGSNSGGGGGGAGATGNGYNASSSSATGGTARDLGGAGGNGKVSLGTGDDGQTFGGGGGGGYSSTSGGAGADGAVKLTW